MAKDARPMSEKFKGALWPAIYVPFFFVAAGTILRLIMKMPSYIFLM